MEQPTASATGAHATGGHAILGITVSTLIIAVFFVMLRCYVRLRITASFWWDDAFIIIGSVLSVVGSAFNILSVNYGAGVHTMYLKDPENQVPKIIMWNTAYQIDNVISVNMVKVSILLFMLRIQNSRILAYTIWAVMAIMSIVNMVTVGALAAQCQPLRKLWIPTIPGTCFYEGELSKFGYGQGVVNVLTDFFCTILPVFIMWNVQMPMRTKVVICSLVSLGLMATASQIVRVILLNTLEAEDYSYQILGIVIAAILDQNLGIIAACIPTFRPLFKSFATTLKNSRANVRSSSKLFGYGRDRPSTRGLEGSHGLGNNAIPRGAKADAGKSFRTSNDSNVPLQILGRRNDEGTTLERRFNVEYGAV